jgi:hypothetical protein
VGIQFTLGEKGLLKKLNQQVIDRLIPIVNVAVDEVVDKLSTRFSDGGIAPYDELKKMYDSHIIANLTLKICGLKSINKSDFDN